MADAPRPPDPAPTFHSERRGAGAALAGLLVETRSVMPAAGATGISLVLVIAAMCFLASLALGAALSVDRVASDWTSDLSGALTVQIKPSPDTAPEEQVDAVMLLLDRTPGILSARALSRADTEALLEPWLGTGNVTPDLPLPRLIDIRVDAAAPPDLEALSRNIAAAAPGATLDTHHQWRAELRRAARAATFLAYGILVAVAATTIAIVTFATRAGLSANREVVEVLHLIGARDRFIAAEVQRHFLHLGFRGGLIGLALSVATFLLLNVTNGGNGLFMVPISGLRPEHYPVLAAVPFAAAAVAVLTARITVMRSLERML
ncbi:FtsX-like permease family protein [uncultured Parvibaculum sp.]|uniref:cell division protein FtsX n=1 Tax=uncultured Parvibaculum sp. TaxID=291828 RepID=UPI0030D8171A